jgi:hypothetical protein
VWGKSIFPVYVINVSIFRQFSLKVRIMGSLVLELGEG